MSHAAPLIASKREARAAPVQHKAANESRVDSEAEEIGVPRWLQQAGTRAAAGDDKNSRVQHKCAACAAGGAPCPACAEEEQRVQRKEQTGRGDGGLGRHVHAVAHRGVESAHEPLPHRDRIQAAFGRHDVTGVKAQVGGAAGSANDSMGSLGYTVGNRIGFRSAPDLRLAAHEATHAVQQRGNVQLDGGVGRPGDVYEQQADAVADAVARGESAEPLLDRGSAPSLVPGSEPVQHLLAINATRQFEPPAPPAPAAGGGGGGGGGGGAAAGAAGESEGAGQEPGEETDAAAEAEAAPDAAAGAAEGAGEGGAGGQGGDGGPPACTGTGDMHCFRKPPEEEPENVEKKEQPEPEATKAKEEISGELLDVPEPDDCPAAEALAAQPGAQPAAGGAAAPGAASGAPQGGAAAPQGSADAGSSEAAAATPEGGGAPAADAGGGGGGGGGSDGGSAGATEPAGGTMDASISLAEAQRGNAAASYAASSTALSTAADGTRALRRSTRFASSGDTSSATVARGEEAGKRVDGFFSGAAGRLDSAIALASQQLPDRLGAQAESAKAALGTAIESQKSAISGRIAQARAQAQSDAAMAREQVMVQAEAFVAEAEAQTATAIETLNASHADAVGQVGDLETSTLETVNQIYVDGRVAHEGLGTTVGNECIARGAEFKAFYEGCKINERDSLLKGYLTDRRAKAQQNAADETAKGFAKSLNDTAKKRARDVVQSGRKADRCAVIAAAGRARDTLDQQLASITGALEAARDSTIQQASDTREALLGSIDGNLTTTLHQLGQQEHDQRQAVDDTGYMQQVLQEQTAHNAAASLQSSAADAVGAAQSGLTAVQARLAASTAPDPAALDPILAMVMERIDGAIAGLEAALESGAAAAEEQLATAASQGLASLEAVTQSSDELASALQDGFGTAMSTIAGTDNFATLRTGFTQQVEQTAQGGSDALALAVDGMSQACDAVTTGAETSLAQSATDLEANLRTQKQGLECEIPKRADQAAAKEAPAWKRALAVLLVIVVIVIMIVVTVVTFGSGGILAGIVVGAIVGAVTSAMLTMASNLWNNQSVMKGVARAALEGAITGAIGGGVGAWAGHAVRAASGAVKFGVGMVTAGLMDAGTQFVMAGGSFKDFSLKQLGLTLLITAVTFKIGAKFGGKIQIGGPKGRAPAVAGVHPTEAPTPTAHATEAPTPTAHAAEAPTPTAHTTEAPTPTAHTTETPTPTAHATEAPAPAGAHPSEPTPGAHTGEAPTAAPDAAPTSAPDAAPTSAPDAAPAESGAAPKTPEEVAVLENTANKPSEELSPTEALTERDVAARGKAEPVNDPPFTTKRKLPNGHDVFETPDGKAFKRCSGVCVIYDSEGRPIGTAEEAPAVGTPTEEAPTTTKVEEEVPTTAKPDEEVPTAKPDEDAPTAKPDEDAPTAKPDEEAPTAKPDEEAPATAKPDEETPATAKSDKDAPAAPAEPEPWTTGKRPDKYQAFRRKFLRKNPGKTPPTAEDWYKDVYYKRYARDLKSRSKGQKKPLGPDEWYEQIGKKDAHNPDGGKGNKEHQDVIKNKLVPKAEAEFPPPRYTAVPEQPLPPGTDVPNAREPDVYVIDNETGKVVKIYEAARFNKSGGLLRTSEKAKIPDYRKAYGGEGIPVEFHPAGPNQPPGGMYVPPAVPKPPTK